MTWVTLGPASNSSRPAHFSPASLRGGAAAPAARAPLDEKVLEFAADPEAASRHREKAEREARVEVWAEPSGTAALAGRDLRPADVIAADKRIDSLARQLKAAGIEGGLGQLRARAYVALLLGQPLPSRLAAAPRTTGTGAVDPWTDRYQPSPGPRHVIMVRQRTCSFPGCRRPASRCDQDHTVPYDQGGPTCECNLVPLCRRHHQAKQVRGWRLEQPVPGTLVWRLPHGRSYWVDPEPYG
jgi:HNH endonuclease